MNILYYDDSLPKENLMMLVKAIQDKVGFDLIAVPKNFELVLDCPVERLLEVRDMIDKALEEKQKESC
jgi:hypothetical protein